MLWSSAVFRGHDILMYNKGYAQAPTGESTVAAKLHYQDPPADPTHRPLAIESHLYADSIFKGSAAPGRALECSLLSVAFDAKIDNVAEKISCAESYCFGSNKQGLRPRALRADGFAADSALVSPRRKDQASTLCSAS